MNIMYGMIYIKKPAIAINSSVLDAVVICTPVLLS